MEWNRHNRTGSNGESDFREFSNDNTTVWDGSLKHAQWLVELIYII